MNKLIYSKNKRYKQTSNGLAEVNQDLSKRDIFTIHALSVVLDKYNPFEHGDFDSSKWEETAKNAVGLADALLAELEK